MKDMTVLLLVKGRDLHTLRWMWHANRIGFAYPILIADGGDNPISRRVLADKSLFPNLDYQYLRYDDATTLDYFKKVVDVTERAQTPFVFRADNDDFILPSGVEKALNFMRANPDFVWCAAPLLHFTIHGPEQPAPHLVGDLYRLLLERRLDIYHSPDPMERLNAFVKSGNIQIYYSVVRHEQFKHIYERKVELNPRNLDLSDNYRRMVSLLSGRHKVILDSVIYLHQTDTSQIHSVHGHFAQRLFLKDYMGDFNRLLGDVCAHAAPERRDEIDQAIREMYARNLRHKIENGEGLVRSGPVGKALRRVLPARRARLALDVADARLRLNAAGASKEHMSALSADIAEVRRSLAGGEFLAFLGAVAPEAFARDAAA
jgi:glycosyltransferase domain-containing protein